MTKNKSTLFLTGVTGTLGKEMIRALLLTTESRLYLLVRSKNNLNAENRARKILANLGLEHHLGARVRVLPGDVTLPDLGLRYQDAQLLDEVDEIYHIAALTTLNGSRDDCFRVNLGGTERMLQLADRLRHSGRLKRFIYFSTAYAVGSLQTHCAKEDVLPDQPAHANHYEASKYASETIVREAMQGGLRATIFRPSIVVGDSKTGKVSEFNVIYPFMKLFAHGILTRLPTRLDNSFNIVPIDFVINASLAIARQDASVGKTFHLVTKEPPSMATLLSLKEKEFPQLPPIEILDPTDFSRGELATSEQIVYNMLEPYIGYLNEDLTFETGNTELFLKGTGIEFPKTDYEFLHRLLRYAVDVGYLIA